MVSPMETIFEGCRTFRVQLDEGAVVGDRHHLPLHPGAHRILLGDILPGIVLELLHAQRDPLPLPVDVEHLHLDLAADLDQLGRVRHPAVRHVGDVQQAIHPAQVDERPEVGDVLDDPLPDLADLELLHQVLALAGPLGLQDHPAAHHDVAAPLVELDDLEFVALPQQLVDIGHPAQRDLRPGQERVHPHHVHHHPALDLLHQGAFDRLIALVGDADLLPHPHEVGLLLREDDRALLVLQVLQEDLDFIAFLGNVLELVQRDRAFGLEADVQDDRVVGDPEHLGLDDLAFGDRGHGALVHREHLLVVLGRVVLVDEVFADPEAGGGGKRFGRGGVGHDGEIAFGPGPGAPPGWGCCPGAEVRRGAF
jgi:hypothetical protein